MSIEALNDRSYHTYLIRGRARRDDDSDFANPTMTE